MISWDNTDPRHDFVPSSQKFPFCLIIHRVSTVYTSRSSLVCEGQYTVRALETQENLPAPDQSSVPDVPVLFACEIKRLDGLHSNFVNTCVLIGGVLRLELQQRSSCPGGILFN